MCHKIILITLLILKKLYEGKTRLFLKLPRMQAHNWIVENLSSEQIQRENEKNRKEEGRWMNRGLQGNTIFLLQEGQGTEGAIYNSVRKS